MVKNGVVTFNVTTPFLTYRLLVLFRGVLYNDCYVMWFFEDCGTWSLLKKVT